MSMHVLDGGVRAKYRRALVICNEDAGGVGPDDSARLQGLLADYVEQITVGGIGSGAALAMGDADLVVVLGGDGTARAVAAAAMGGREPVLILLPGGTLNVLPRALYGDLPWEEALAAALQRGEMRRLTGGLAAGRPFFVAAAFGQPTLIAPVREAMRQGEMGRAWRRFRLFLRRVSDVRIRARIGRRRLRKTSAVGVLAPSFSGGVEANALEWATFDGSTMWDLIRVGAGVLSSDWRNDKTIAVAPGKAGDIVSSRPIPGVLDGEPCTFDAHVRIEIIEKGPKVLALPQGTY